jgi:hypothetical protein
VPTSYPGAVDLAALFAPDVTDDTDRKSGAPRTGTVGFHAQWMRDAGGALVAVETELGVNPSGSFVDVATRLDQMLTVRKTADQTFTTATLVSATDLSFPLAVGRDYTFMFWLPWSAATAGVTQQHAVTFPAAAYGQYASESFTQTAPATEGTDMVSTSVQAASGARVGGVGGTSIPAAAVRTFTRIMGIVSNPSAAGTLQLQAATETASNSTLYKGAWGVLWTN